MSRKTQDIKEEFRINLEGCKDFSEEKLLEEINKTTIKVEKCDFYSTNLKLKIYAGLSTLSNCEPSTRKRTYKKVLRLL
ncbi:MULTISPECIES: hypothetical protein [Terrabacteria group]|uniref:hypothetical protein n=1 Tax=Bacillati TaxID=1783272 RepID=UPI0019396F91|nr:MULTISPECIES: hypothetical protein [Terrabacteria group]MBW9211914.1 hypothetical protein [Trueperella sp. zg.1013]QRG87285.1 hypothetical protein JOS54_02955 [Bulleidia sp. zg-1006]